MVSMRDGVKLATDVYLPYEDYPPHGCILIRLPYNKDNVEQFLNGQDYDLEEWVDGGWPFVVQDERGFFGRSWCANEMKEHNLKANICQANTSLSKKKTKLIKK